MPNSMCGNMRRPTTYVYQRCAYCTRVHAGVRLCLLDVVDQLLRGIQCVTDSQSSRNVGTTSMGIVDKSMVCVRTDNHHINCDGVPSIPICDAGHVMVVVD